VQLKTNYPKLLQTQLGIAEEVLRELEKTVGCRTKVLLSDDKDEIIKNNMDCYTAIDRLKKLLKSLM
jgi:hypothetical protein